MITVGGESVAQYSEVREDQKALLRRAVARAEEIGNPAFVWQGGTKLQERRGTPFLSDVSPDGVFYQGLADKGFLTLRKLPEWQMHHQGLELELDQKAFDFVRYDQQGRFLQTLSDLRYDLGHNDSLRARLLWAIGTVVVADLVAIALKRLGLL